MNLKLFWYKTSFSHFSQIKQDTSWVNKESPRLKNSVCEWIIQCIPWMIIDSNDKIWIMKFDGVCVRLTFDLDTVSVRIFHWAQGYVTSSFFWYNVCWHRPIENWPCCETKQAYMEKGKKSKPVFRIKR